MEVLIFASRGAFSSKVGARPIAYISCWMEKIYIIENTEKNFRTAYQEGLFG